MREVRNQKAFELIAVEFLDVIRVLVPDQVRVHVAIRARNHQQPVRGQHPLDFAQHRVLREHVFERLEADHDIDRVIAERDRLAGALPELDLWLVVLQCGVPDNLGRDVDTDGVRGYGCKERGPIPFAAGDIENALTVRQFTGEEVPVHMLQANVTSDLWHIPLPIPRQDRSIVASAHRGLTYGPQALSENVSERAKITTSLT